MCGNLHGTRTLFLRIKGLEAVLWYLNAASETPSIIDIHSSGDAPLACLSKCYSTLAAQAKQDKNAELSAAFLAQAEDYQAQAEHWQAAI